MITGRQYLVLYPQNFIRRNAIWKNIGIPPPSSLALVQHIRIEIYTIHILTNHSFFPPRHTNPKFYCSIENVNFINILFLPLHPPLHTQNTFHQWNVYKRTNSVMLKLENNSIVPERIKNHPHILDTHTPLQL